MTIETTLRERCQAKCELCSDTSELTVYPLPPVTEKSAAKSAMICTVCLTGIDNPSQGDVNRWRCLGESMWSEHPAVQVLAWRILKKLPDQSWAQDLINQLYLDDETLKWAESDAGKSGNDADDTGEQTKDSNGNVLINGDSVTLIKDLDVKGANFTAKRGTVVKNISLTANPAHIEGRVNGTQIVLLTCFLKKT